MGTCLFAAVFNSAAAASNPQDANKLLPLAGACLGVMLLLIGNQLSYQATDIEQMIHAVGLSIGAIGIYHACFAWFVLIYSRYYPRTFAIAFTGLAIVLFAVNSAMPYSMQYTELSAIERVRMPWGETLSFPVGRNSTWFFAATALFFANHLIQITAIYRTWRDDPRFVHLAILIALVVLFAGTTFGIYVRLGGDHILYLSPYSFVIVLVVTSFVMAHDIRLRLVKSERRFSSLFDSASDGIITLDTDGQTAVCNDNCRILLSLDSNRLDRVALERQLQRLGVAQLLEPSPERENKPRQIDAEREITAAGGTTSIVDSVATQLTDGSAIIVLRDVTERALATKTLQHERESLTQSRREGMRQLEAANRDLEAFSYSVSHDLLSPLRAIDGFSRLVAQDKGSDLSDDARNHLERVHSAIRHMRRRIEALLDMARIGRTQLVRARLDLGAIAREVLVGLRGAEPERDVEVLISGDLTARGDPRLLEVVMENLIGNAWKYTANVGQPVIRIDAYESAGEKIYRVSDNGAGFDMRWADKLFKAFQRLHGSEFSGTGVGLYTVARIVDRHGGRIWAEAAVNEGATFMFTLAEPKQTA